MDTDWERFEKKGDRLYNHIVNHYEDMFDSSGKLPYFFMRYTTYYASGYHDRLDELYGEEVHEKISEWIHEERLSGRLFDKTLWKPFRDQCSFTTMYYGYRKLFSFTPHNDEHRLEAMATYRYYAGDAPDMEDLIMNGSKYTYYFQLAVDEDLHEISFGSTIRTIDYQVAFHGWKKDDEQTLPYDKKDKLEEDMMMPEKYWSMK